MARKINGVPRQKHVVQVYVTDEEIAYLDRICNALMCSRSQYFRNCLLGALLAQKEGEKKGVDWLAYIEKLVSNQL